MSDARRTLHGVRLALKGGNALMLSDTKSHMRLNHFVRKYLRRGYEYAAHSEFSAVLQRSAQFPHWLFPEITLYVKIDPEGRIFVERRRE